MSPRSRRRLHRFAAPLVALVVTFVGVRPVAAAQGWTTGATPTGVAVGQSGDVLVTIQNTSGNNGGGEGIGCVTIDVPADYTIDSVAIDQVDGGHAWSVASTGSNPARITTHANGNTDRILGSPDLERVVLRVAVTGVNLGASVWTADEYNNSDCTGNYNRTRTIAMSVVVPPNSAPVATGDTASVIHDRVKTVAAPGVLGNDTDADGDALSAVADTQPGHGSLVLGSDGGYTYTPDAGYVGADSFTYHASDGTASSGTVTVGITVTNGAPTGGPDAYSTAHGLLLVVPASSGVLANDSDPDGDPITAVVQASPSHGVLVLGAAGGFTYVPDLLWVGADSFTYRVSDGVATSPAVTVSIDAVNTTPAGNADAYEAVHDRVLSVAAGTGVLANDVDSDGDTLTAALVTAAAHGAVVLAADGSFSYSPDAGYVGADTFTYRASDGIATSGVVTVSLDVTNVAPAADDGAAATLHDQPIAMPASSGVLAGDTDADGDALTAILVANVTHGTLSLASDGGWSYAPDAGYVGADSFTYRASDGIATSAIASVAITVTDLAPTAADDAYTVVHDGVLAVPAAGGVLANDADGDGDPLVAVLAAGPAHGSLALAADGSFTYTPTPAYAGPDGFTYTVSAGPGTSSAGSVTLDVTNVAPVAVADAYAGHFGVPVVVPAASGVLANDTDADGDPLSATLIDPPATGTLVLAADGGFSYTPPAGAVGPITATYEVGDGVTTTGPVTLTITLDDVAPTAADDAGVVVHDRVLVVPASDGVLGNDGDADADPLIAVLQSFPAHGDVVLALDGGWTYTPDPGWTGDDSFTYRAFDGGVVSNLATVTITVTNEAPVTADDTWQATHDSPLVIAAPGVVGNDNDADGDAMTVALLTPPASGSVVMAPDGGFVYTPAAGWIGTDAWTYEVTDGVAVTAGTVRIDVVNTPPLAAADAYSTVEGTSLVVAAPGVLANDTDHDGDHLVATLLTPPASGSLTLGGDGRVAFVPSANGPAVATFTYSVSDGLTSSSPTAVAITVRPRPTPTPSPTPTPTPAPVASDAPAPDPTSDPRPAATPEASPPLESPSPAPSASPSPTPPPAGAGSGVPPVGGGGTGPDTFTVGGASGGGAGDAAGFGPAALALALDGFDWQIPGLLLSVPGLLVVIAIGLQLLGGAAWLPVARRVVGSFGLGKRRRAASQPG